MLLDLIVLATSGIDHDIKLWSPIGEKTGLDINADEVSYNTN